MEKAYRAMKNSGAGSIAVGIIVLVVGVTAGGVFIIKRGGVHRAQKKKKFLLKKGRTPYEGGPSLL